MLNEIALGLGMVIATTITHALFMMAARRVLALRHSLNDPVTGHFEQTTLIALLTVWMFLAHVIEAWGWALLYLYHPLNAELPDLETALYFSMVTFTTVGYGDVVLSGGWRLLASIQAANGVILFGWTTALIFYFIQHIYENE